jgi:hypothetical protein
MRNRVASVRGNVRKGVGLLCRLKERTIPLRKQADQIRAQNQGWSGSVTHREGNISVLISVVEVGARALRLRR